MTRNLMVQGTSSGAGKSILSIGLCRILYQEEFSVAPFKSQNISGNSYKMPDGTEMAKTQALAAAACELEPDFDMNPILLKPARGGTDVIVHGRSIGWMNGNEYREFKRRKAWAPVLESYRRLSNRHDRIILEGAGSPVELNMKEDDIANMNMASRVGAPVILVTDIDRGGVFALVKGTLDLLTDDERDRVKGVIVNKCRGRLDLFEEVRQMLESITGVPVLGMVPYLDIEIEDEDNLCDPATGLKKQNPSRDVLIRQFDRLAGSLRAHIDVPRIIEILEQEAGVSA